MTINNPFLDKENEDLIKFFQEEVFQRKDLDIHILSGDASTRRYFRVTSDDTSFQSVIIMVSGKENLQDIHSHIECYNFFKQIGFCIPELYEAVPERGYLIEEDVGDTSLEVYMNSGGNSTDFYQYYQKGIAQIVLLQNSFEFPEIVHSFSHSLPLRHRFTEKKFTDELKMFYDYFFVRYLNMDIPEREDIENIFYHISEELLEQGLLPTHRDFHSRNLFIKSGELYVLDFQDARLGPPHYDLVSFIYDPYVRISESTRKRLIGEYKKKVYLSSYTSFNKTFDRMMQLCAIQRLLKAIGTYAFMYLDRHNSFYLQFIVNAIRDLERLMQGKKEFEVILSYLKEAAEKEWGR
ncbi:MAG: phosphotransferase [Candidatus Aureabacteria bacterium]|nr:phosphotransferase [Candidatus Auribacterota bacterium]